MGNIEPIIKRELDSYVIDNSNITLLANKNELNMKEVTRDRGRLQITNSTNFYKLELENRLTYFRDFILAKHDYTFNVDIVLERLWNLKKIGYMNPPFIAWISKEESPIIFCNKGKSENVLVVSPKYFTFISDKNRDYENRGVDKKLKQKVRTQIVKRLIKEPDFGEMFYTIEEV